MTACPVDTRSSSTTRSRSATVVPAQTTRAPVARIFVILVGAASTGRTIVACRPYPLAATATARPWLPVLCAMTPAISVSSESRPTARVAPRTL